MFNNKKFKLMEPPESANEPIESPKQEPEPIKLPPPNEGETFTKGG